MMSNANGARMRVVLCTFPDSDVAERVARELVERRLAACVNLLPEIVSVYRWNGQVERAREVLAIIKTTADAADRLAHELERLHPYEVPEIAGLEVSEVNAGYLRWLEESVPGESCPDVGS